MGGGSKNGQFFARQIQTMVDVKMEPMDLQLLLLSKYLSKWVAMDSAEWLRNRQVINYLTITADQAVMWCT